MSIKNKKRMLAFVTIGLLLLLLIMTGCKNSHQKYDVSMVIFSHEAGEHQGIWDEKFVFLPQISELHIERKYDGKEYLYYFEGFCFIDRPMWPELWFSHSQEFSCSSSLYKCTDKKELVETVCDRGEYCLEVTTNQLKDLNERTIKLYITVI